MTVPVGTEERTFTPCKVEPASPSTDWSLSWAACRQPGIPPDLASFLWKMMHGLLLSQAKLHRMGTTQSPTCKMKGCSEDGTIQHELISCSKNDEIGQKLIRCLHYYVPGLQVEAALRLEFGDTDEDHSLPLTLLTAIILQAVWKQREPGVPIRSYRVRAEMEQYINLLRTTRHINSVTLLETMLNLMLLRT